MSNAIDNKMPELAMMMLTHYGLYASRRYHRRRLRTLTNFLIKHKRDLVELVITSCQPQPIRPEQYSHWECVGMITETKERIWAVVRAPTKERRYLWVTKRGVRRCALRQASL